MRARCDRIRMCSFKQLLPDYSPALHRFQKSWHKFEEKKFYYFCNYSFVNVMFNVLNQIWFFMPSRTRCSTHLKLIDKIRLDVFLILNLSQYSKSRQALVIVQEIKKIHEFWLSFIKNLHRCLKTNRPGCFLINVMNDTPSPVTGGGGNVIFVTLMWFQLFFNFFFR